MDEFDILCKEVLLHLHSWHLGGLAYHIIRRPSYLYQQSGMERKWYEL